MIEYEKFRFAAPPRTASTWFMKAASLAGLGDGYKATVHIPAEPTRNAALSVSMIRHPVDWLVSYFQTLKGGTIGVTCVDVFVPVARRAANVHEFLDSYLVNCRGMVGAMFDTYAADSVYRVEDLPWAVCEFFETLGLSRDKADAPRDLGPQNPWNGVPPAVDPDVRRRIVSAETDFCERYDYF